MDYMNFYEYLAVNRIGKIKLRREAKLDERVIKAIFSGQPILPIEILNICDTFGIAPSEVSEDLTFATTKDLRLFVNESIKNRKPHKLSRPVTQRDLDGKALNIFVGRLEAERITGISHATITRCCSGKRKTAGGYIWTNS